MRHHYSITYTQSLHAINGCGTSGKLTLWTPPVPSATWSEPRFRLATIRPKSQHLPFGASPTRPVLLQSGAIVAPRKFHSVSNTLQVCGKPECGAQFCDILKLPLITHGQSIGDQQPTGSKELNCFGFHVVSSCTEVVLNGIPAFPAAY